MADPAGTLTERQRQIAAAARALLDEHGPEALTMRNVAEALGIRAPSLYKHVPDKTVLETLVVANAFAELAQILEAAQGLPEIARAYRAYAREHPHLYRLMNYRPLRRDLLPPGLEERSAHPLMSAAGGNPARARALWAFAHGMVSLEIDGRFPDDADVAAAWLAGLESFGG